MPHHAVAARQVIRRRLTGPRAAAIAAAPRPVPRTVRHLLQRWRRRKGPASLAVSYVSPVAARSRTVRELRDEAERFRRDHPTWGAGLIRVHLRRAHPRHELPAERTIQRWLERAGLAPRGRRPGVNPDRAARPHEVWQMDAAERRAGGQEPGLVAAAGGRMQRRGPAHRVFPLGCWSSVPVAEVRTALRQAFRRWGRPLRLRVDNGVPWGSSGDLPPDLALWLLGGRGDVAESAASSPGQRRREPLAGHRQTVGGTSTCTSAAELQGPPEGHGPDPARSIPVWTAAAGSKRFPT